MPIARLISLSIVIFSSFMNLNGQEVEVHSGVSVHSISKDDYSHGHDSQDYEGSVGIHYSIGYISKKKYGQGEFPLRIYFSVDHYGGKWKRIGGSQGSGRIRDFEFQKTLVSLTHYWFKIKLYKDFLQINLGPEVSFLFREQADGLKRYRDAFTYDEEFINYNSEWVSNSVRLAFKLRLMGRIPINKNVSIKPQYILTRGISNEFPDGTIPTRILAHRFDVGLGITL